jgi:hypothetical protein
MSVEVSNEFSVASAFVADPPPTSMTAAFTSGPCITAETAAAVVTIASGVDAASMSVFSTEAAPEETFATAVTAAELGASALFIVPPATASVTELYAIDSTVSSEARSNVARSLRLPENCSLASTIFDATAPTT